MCPMPKNYLTNINIKPTKIGVDRRKELLENIENKGTFLPKPVLFEDMDSSVIDHLNSDKGFALTLDGKKTPVIFLTLQRWGEFSKTWQFSDEHKSIQLPFITLVRKPDIQQGQNQAGSWNIPGKRTYTYFKVPTNDGARVGMDLYKVPQPTSVDITYEVRLFTTKMKDLNEFNRKIQLGFQSKQCYINVNDHPMPLILENISDESNIDDFENRRFYVQLFELKLLGYILDSNDFEIIPAINRSITSMELDDKNFLNNGTVNSNIDGNTATYTFVFKPNSPLEFSFLATYEITFTQLINIENISRIVIYINGVGVFDGLVMTSPLNIKSNDNVTVKIYKNNSVTGKFQLIGTVNN